MMRRGNAVLIGAFVVVGLVLVVATVLACTGGKLFSRREAAVMFLDTSVYGLQIGAPVALRGVRLGSVSLIGLFHEKSSEQFSIPVVVELERETILSLRVGGTRSRDLLTLPALVSRGMSAQLSMQKLADLLERQPDALLCGRPRPETSP